MAAPLALRAVIALAAFLPALAAALDPGPPVLGSVRWDNGEPTGLCAAPVQFGPDSRFVSVSCFGDDIAPGDSNDRRDTVLLDRDGGQPSLISVSSLGVQTIHHSLAGYPSANGRRVAFVSLGSLHPDYWPPPTLSIGRPAIYLRDRLAGETLLVGRDAFGVALTGNPQLRGANFLRNEVLFEYAGDLRTGPNQIFGLPGQVWVRNWLTGTVELVSARPDGEPASGVEASFSATARYVVFISGSDDLGPAIRLGDQNVFVRDRQTGTIERLTRPWAGPEFQGAPVTLQQPRISADGRFVVFASNSTELHPETATAGGTRVYVLDRQTGQLEHVSATPGYSSFNTNPRISDDGRYVAWSTRNFSFNGPPDPPADMRAIWVLDRHTGQRVNVTAPLGPLHQDNAVFMDLAPDSRAVAFNWRIADPAHPLFARDMLYTVQLRGSPPAAPPVPVPVVSAWLLGLLAAAVLLGGWARFRRVRG